MEPNFHNILEQGVEITSSGTTGPAKTIKRTPKDLLASAKTAIEAQCITKQSRIYTCTRMTHAGGLLLQSLPAYTLGCDIKITKFNAFTFLKEFEDYSHTFLPPAMVQALMMTKDFKTCKLDGKFFAMGSDLVPAKHIQAFIDKGATVQANWGMSEIGPCVINKTFKPGDTVECDGIVGDTKWCDYKIEHNQLYVKSDMCVYDGWFNTGDLVYVKNDCIYYLGRK